MKLNFYLILLLILITESAYSQQTIVLSTPKALVVNAGADTTILLHDQIYLGGSPTSEHGKPPYSYNWTPVVGLNDPYSPNPMAAPEDTTTYTLEVTDSNGCSSISAVTINVLVLGINEKSNQNDITLYPNPSSDKLFIHFRSKIGKVEISLATMNGTITQQKTLFIENESTHELDINSEAIGAHCLTIESKDFKISRSIIIK